MDSKVVTMARLAQWRIDDFGYSYYNKQSDPFKIGLWNWHLSVERNRDMYHIRLFPESSRLSKEQPPIARFVLRVITSGNNSKPYISPVHERLLRTSDDFVLRIDTTFKGRLVIDVEFLDLKFGPTGERIPLWPSDGKMQSLAAQSTLRCLSRMLDESIHADVTINTSDGSVRAHKAILSASSPVFHSMFIHNFKEKESSTINIEDMSTESCLALLSYLYGTIKHEDFWKHRLALLDAANKYDIADLKDSCEKSLLEDIDTGNVLERLQEARLYQLNRLKKGCLMYLLDFGKIYDIQDEINNFFSQADIELKLEMFLEVLAVWKPV